MVRVVALHYAGRHAMLVAGTGTLQCGGRHVRITRVAPSYCGLRLAHLPLSVGKPSHIGLSDRCPGGVGGWQGAGRVSRRALAWLPD